MMHPLQLRFYLAARLMRLPYGHTTQVDGDDAHKAWPPTGDHDRSLEGMFRALSLSASGNRPEDSYTTKERIERDLDESFIVRLEPERRDWIIHRKLECCPRCYGNGRYKEEIPSPMPPRPVSQYSRLSSADIVSSIRIVECDHKPT